MCFQCILDLYFSLYIITAPRNHKRYLLCVRLLLSTLSRNQWNPLPYKRSGRKSVPGVRLIAVHYDFLRILKIFFENIIILKILFSKLNRFAVESEWNRRDCITLKTKYYKISYNHEYNIQLTIQFLIEILDSVLCELLNYAKSSVKIRLESAGVVAFNSIESTLSSDLILDSVVEGIIGFTSWCMLPSSSKYPEVSGEKPWSVGQYYFYLSYNIDQIFNGESKLAQINESFVVVLNTN